MSVIKKFNNFFVQIILKIIKYLDFHSMMKLRNYLYSFLLDNIGKKSNICASVTIISPQNIFLGDRVSIHHNCYIGGRGKIKIGNYVSIATSSIIVSEEHNYKDLDILIKDQGVKAKDILIEDNVWIGANAVILGGVKVREGTVVAAGAVVKKDTEKNSIVGGVPAKLIKFRA